MDYDPTQKRIGYWNPQTQSYMEYPFSGSMGPGWAGWFLFRSDTTVMFEGGITPSEIGPDGSDAFKYPLYQGWNQVGNPFNFPIQIKAATTPGELMVSIYGKEALPYEVRLERRIRRVEAPFDSPTARPGLEIQLYRVRFKETVEMNRERVSVDVYPPVHDWKETDELESPGDRDGSNGSAHSNGS